MPRLRLNTWPENEGNGSDGASEIPSPSGPFDRSSTDSALSVDDDVPLLSRWQPRGRRAEALSVDNDEPPRLGSYDVTAVCRAAPLVVDVIFVGVTSAAYMTDLYVRTLACFDQQPLWQRSGRAAAAAPLRMQTDPHYPRCMRTLTCPRNLRRSSEGQLNFYYPSYVFMSGHGRLIATAGLPLMALPTAIFATARFLFLRRSQHDHARGGLVGCLNRASFVALWLSIPALCGLLGVVASHTAPKQDHIHLMFGITYFIMLGRSVAPTQPPTFAHRHHLHPCVLLRDRHALSDGDRCLHAPKATVRRLLLPSYARATQADSAEDSRADQLPDPR